VSRRTEWGLWLSPIVVVAVATALLDRDHNYWFKPQLSAHQHPPANGGSWASSPSGLLSSSSRGASTCSSGSVIAFSGTVCAILMTLLAPEAVKESGALGGWVIVAAILGTLLVGVLIGSFHAGSSRSSDYLHS